MNRPPGDASGTDDKWNAWNTVRDQPWRKSGDIEETLRRRSSETASASKQQGTERCPYEGAAAASRENIPELDVTGRTLLTSERRGIIFRARL